MAKTLSFRNLFLCTEGYDFCGVCRIWSSARQVSDCFIVDFDLHMKGWRLRQVGVGLSDKLNYVRTGRRVGLSIYIHSVDCSYDRTCTISYFLP